uniref:Ovule protein n=1 Tax=Heterorhabditis bacteriophora TaxID=37862 RepID=A0A1I7WAC6_HETBA
MNMDLIMTKQLMSLVELRRNSSPHIGSVTLQASPVWRKSSHPPFSTESTMDELKQRVLVPNRGVNKNETKIEVVNVIYYSCYKRIFNKLMFYLN